MLTSESSKQAMIPYVEFPCPNCAHRLRVKFAFLGGQLRCKYCAHEFASPAPGTDFPWTAPARQETDEDQQAAQRRIAVLEAELGSLREELASRTAEYTAASDKFQQAQDEVRRLHDQIHQAWADQRNAGDFKQKLAAAEAELQAVRVELASRMTQFTASTATVEQTQDELHRLHEQVHQAWVDQRNASELNQKLAAELEQLRAQAQMWQERAAEAELQAAAVTPEQPQQSVARSLTPPSNDPGATRNRLLEKAQSIRAQLEASSSIQERIDRLNTDLEAAHVERDRLNGEWQTAAAEAAQLRTKVAELEHCLAELTTAHAQTAQAFQQGQAQWESERQTLHRDLEEQHQSHVREAEQHFEEEIARIEADRRQLQEQFDAVRHEHEEEVASLRNQVEQLRQESAGVRAACDAERNQLQALGEERNRIAAERDAIDARYQESVEGFRADMARLTQAWQESQQQETAAAAQNQALTEQLEQLRRELDEQRGRETEHQQTLAALQQAADAARAEAAEEKGRAEAERQKWREQLDAAQRQLDENKQSSQSEVERLRDEVTALHEALAIVGVIAE